MRKPPKIPFEKEKEILQTADEFRTEARKHWEYTRKILESSMRNFAGVYGLELVGVLAMCETIYIEAMIHGYKHALEATDQEASIEQFRRWINHDDLHNIEHAQGLLELVQQQFALVFPDKASLSSNNINGEKKP